MTIEGFETVQTDVIEGLRHIFTPTGADAFQVHPTFREFDGVLGADGVQVVPWVYTCVHTGSQPLPEGNNLEGLFVTGLPIEVHGVTVLDTRVAQQPVVLRYIDWLGVITQLGLQVSWRVPVNEDQYVTNMPNP